MLNKISAKFLLSNSNIKFVKDYFKGEKFTVDIIECRRTINSKKPNSKTKEVLIFN